MNKIVFVFGLFLLFINPSNLRAGEMGLCCAKCGGNMPMNIPGGGVPETHEFRFKTSLMTMNMDGLRKGTKGVEGNSLLGMPAMGKYMAVPEKMDMNMGHLAAGYSFTDDFFGGIMFMHKRNSMKMAFSDMMKMTAKKEGFTMESEGLGDTMLMTKYRLYTDDPLIPLSQASLFLGLSLPTGSINEKNGNHPLAMRRGELLPYGMQLGSGTFDPTVGLLYQGSRSPLWWGLNLMYTLRDQKNSHDYNLGDRFTYDLYSMYQLRHDLLSYLQLNGEILGQIEGENDQVRLGLSGRATPGNAASPYMSPLWDPDNYGGHKIFATAGFQWQPLPLQILDLGVSLPLYQDLNGSQLEEDYRLMVTWYLELPTKSSIRYGGNKRKRESRLGF